MNIYHKILHISLIIRTRISICHIYNNILYQWLFILLFYMIKQTFIRGSVQVVVMWMRGIVVLVNIKLGFRISLIGNRDCFCSSSV